MIPRCFPFCIGELHEVLYPMVVAGERICCTLWLYLVCYLQPLTLVHVKKSVPRVKRQGYQHTSWQLQERIAGIESDPIERSFERIARSSEVESRFKFLVEMFWICTPWKINMEPTNHPFRKENDLNQTSMIMFHVNLQGCIQRKLMVSTHALT